MKKNLSFTITLILAILLLRPLPSAAQQNLKLIDSFMNAEVASRAFNGNVLIAKSGRILYQKAFGLRNYETKQALNNNSVFELASISKQFTAMGILMLIQQGKIRLTDTLRAYFPELPYHDITIKQLLTHTSGLPEYDEAMEGKWDEKKVAFNKDVIAFMAAQKPLLNFTPGTKWKYSNTGYVLLASIIEKVSGEHFADYLQKYIFTPLGMRHTRVYNTRRSFPADTIPNYAYGYAYSDSLKKYTLPDNIPQLNFVIYLDGIVGDGTVNSTTGDLFLWSEAMKSHKLINTTLQQQMLSRQALIDTTHKSEYYGYGYFVGQNELGNYLQHSGGWPGYGNYMIRYTDADLTIIVLSNNEASSVAVSSALEHIMFNQNVILPYSHHEVSVDAGLIDRYTGHYIVNNTQKNEFDLIRKNGALCLHRKGRPDQEFKAESGSKFFYGPGAIIQIAFQLKPDGSVDKGFFILYDVKYEMVKR